MKKPQTKTIKAVLEYLSTELGLSVYGPNILFPQFAELPGHRDYDLELILELQSLWKKYPNGPTRVSY